ALQDAKAQFPTGVNGQPLIPYGSTWFTATGNNGFEDMLLEFLAIPREIDGQYFDTKCGNPAPDYINWLKTFRQAHELGLMPTDIFVDDRTKIEEKIQQGRYFALMYQWKDAMNPLGQLYTENPDSVYISVEGPANSNMDAAKLGVPGYSGWELTMITKNCKDPARAIRLMSWGMGPDGQAALYLGVEGESYDMVDGAPVIKDEVNTMKNLDMATFKEQYNTFGEIWMFNTSAMNLWEPDPGLPFTQYREWGLGNAAHYGEFDNIRPPADSDEGDILVKAEAKWGEILPQLLMADTDEAFDEIWSNYEDYKESIDYQKALDYQRVKVAENKAKLGMS
ncbi:MAG: ABC transporter substrate-binding protein, partial [Acetanaerobacterium sp.]